MKIDIYCIVSAELSNYHYTMQLEELKTFIAIIESGSLVKASARLNVTQSTVTARLKSLEAELGQVLVNRAKSGATLTAAGVRLQRYATTIGDLWGQAKREIGLPRGYSALCNFGCHVDLWHDAGEKIFDVVHQSAIETAVSVSTGTDEDLVAWLQSGLIDMGLAYRPGGQQNLVTHDLFDERLILVSTRPDSPVRFDPNYIFVEAGEEFGTLHAAAYSDADTARISFSNAQLGYEYLIKYGGSAYLPERLVTRPMAQGKLHTLTDAPVFTRSAYLVCNKSMQPSWPWFDACLALYGK